MRRGDLRDGVGEDADVVAGVVGVRVARTQGDGEEFSGVVAPHPGGGEPRRPLKSAAPCPFSGWGVTGVGSTWRTTVSPGSAPAAPEAGTPWGSRPQTRRRARARAFEI